MARLDVYPGARGKGYLLDCQPDFLSDLESRVVVPLMPATGLPATTRLNPMFTINGEKHVMTTQLIFAIPTERLGKTVASLAREQLTIIAALDMLISGF
ncbi:MAG: CcdB family protein [Pseudomonadota bacterium]